MKVKRETYLAELKARMHNGLVKILTGIRRSGKSYLLSVLFRDYLREIGVDDGHVIEVPLDRDEFEQYRDAISLGDYVRSRLPKDGRWTNVFLSLIHIS